VITTVGDELKGNAIHRKDRLIITAIDIINESGIQGLSTREISKKEGVSDATLFRHYKNKNELIIAVLEYYARFDFDIYESAKLKQLQPLEALTYMVKSLSEYYENYPAITSVMQIFDVVRYEPEVEETVKKILNNRTKYMMEFIDVAKNTGYLPSNIDSENFSDLISGFCREICLKWRVNGQTFSLSERVLSTLKMLFDQFRLIND
jgi:Transcriptional regulator